MANKKTSIKSQKQKNNDQSYNAFKEVLFYSLLIIVLPILSFFTTKFFLFDGYFELESVKSNIWSAVVAIITLHIVLGLYISKAYFGSDIPSDKEE